jgi:hypothetical protein
MLNKGQQMDKARQVRFRDHFYQRWRDQGRISVVDIAGDDIPDQELANYLVRDMRLLMVEQVHI